MTQASNYSVEQLDAVDPTTCPCGQTRRAFLDNPDAPASVHIVDITADSKTHYHKKHTELYLILQGQGRLELDGDTIPVKPMTAILIKPLCRHRAVGNLKLINIVIPPFDPNDEWCDDD